ncbi:MAG TPA: single-stranded DNA-binding protein [Bacilli bacterium]|nr:single-stranded DNA-binding protein [Bacilli bacterium]
MNRAEIIGNLTKDPESRTTPTGQTVVNVSVATNKKWTDSNGQKKERVEFHNIVVWGKMAENFVQYMHKGSKVFIAGELQTRTYDDKNGVKHYRTEIIAREVVFLGTKPSDTATAPQNDVDARNQVEEEEGINIEDIPF